MRGKERRLCSVEKLQQSLWLSFFRASLDADVVPTVLIAASHGDCCMSRASGCLGACVSPLTTLVHPAVQRQDQHRSRFFVLNCRRSKSPEMKQLK